MTKLPILDVLIIGGGPAGLSAALTLGRQRHTVIVFDSERYRNDPSESLHLIPSWDRKSPEGFRASARFELGTYDTVQIKTCEVVSVAKSDDGHFEATDVFGMGYSGRKLILANGVYEIFPDISGYRECWGNSIFHCLFCHGYEKRGGKSSGILAMQMIAIPKFAVHMAHMAAQLTPQVTIYTNGNEQLAQEVMAISGDRPPWKVDTRVIKSLKKNAEAGLEIYFEDGSHMKESFLGHSPFTHVNGPFAEQLGLKLTPTGDYNVMPPFSETSVQGVYAVGDCMTMFKVAPNAVASGSQTAAGIAIKLQETKYGLESIF